MGAKQNLRYHIVLVAKYRRKALLGIEDAVLAAVEATASGSAFTIERAAVEYGDHLHLVLRTTGTYSVSSMVKRIKAGTTQTLWGGHEPHLRKFYWGRTRKLWSGGYYAATIGDVSTAQVEKYPKKQGHWK